MSDAQSANSERVPNPIYDSRPDPVVHRCPSCGQWKELRDGLCRDCNIEMLDEVGSL